MTAAKTTGWLKTSRPGIFVRHAKACASHGGGRCRCEKSWRVRYRNSEGKSAWSPTLKSESEARNWRKDDKNARTPAARSSRPGDPFNALFDEWEGLARSGAVAKKGGRHYSPGTLDAYKSMFNGHVRKELGKRDASRLTIVDWQLLVDGMARAGFKRNSISVTVNAVRAVYRWACAPNRRKLLVNETAGLELPADDETPRDRVANPKEAAALLGALKLPDRTSYALALYAGLRNIERRDFDWANVDFTRRRLNIMESKGDDDGAGVRKLPIIAPLLTILREEHLRQGRPPTGIVCRGPKGGRPDIESLRARAVELWEAAGLEPIGLHEARHSFVTSMIDAGVNAKAVQTLAGHASIDVTFDKYGHLFPGAEDEAGKILDGYFTGKDEADDFDGLSRAELAARLRALVSNGVSNGSPVALETQ
ncbi:MAG: integrase [Conexibacter sp.]|nr:integrase [Conexibacter sp.]